MQHNDTLIRGGRVVGCGEDRTADVLICNGRIVRIAEKIDVAPSVRIIDATGKVVTYGLADVHVHLREPGFSAKETIATGTRAAARGGYTTVCAMPNLNPAPDSAETLAVEQRLIDGQAVIDVRPYATITRERHGKGIVDIKALVGKTAGFSDDGNGVQDEATMAEAMRKVAEADGIIAAHCEIDSLLKGGYIHDGEYARANGHKGICSESEWGQIARDVKLVADSGCRYHVCHISTAESVDIIRKARAEGVKVTCETAPHYLTMCDEDLRDEGRFKMNPPLRSAADRDALIEGILDGTVECIATDHAPHTAEEKSKGLRGSAMGIVGLETAFGVMYTHLVKTGKITLSKLFELMSENPRRIFRLGGALREREKANIAIFDLDTEYTVDPDSFLSMGKATPFAGWKLYGKCVCTLYRGEVVWQEY